MRTKLLSLLPLLALAGVSLAFQQADARPMADKAKVVAHQLPSYPLTTCPISGEELGAMGDPVDFVHEGRLVRFCCENCIKGFEKDPAKAFAKIDAAVIAEQKPSYPMTTCPVSGNELGDTVVDSVHGTRLVRFCCPKCPTAFAKTPDKYMAKVDEALIAAQVPSYPMTTCPVSGEELGDEPVDRLYGTQLVRFCCKKCPKAFFENPAKFKAKMKGLKHLREAGSGGK